MSDFFRVVCMMNRRRTYGRSFEFFFSELQGKKSFFCNIKEKLFGKPLEECTSGLNYGGGRYKLCRYLTVQTHICFVELEKYHLLPFVLKSSRKDQYQGTYVSYVSTFKTIDNRDKQKKGDNSPLQGKPRPCPIIKGRKTTNCLSIYF